MGTTISKAEKLFNVKKIRCLFGMANGTERNHCAQISNWLCDYVFVESIGEFIPGNVYIKTSKNYKVVW